MEIIFNTFNPIIKDFKEIFKKPYYFIIWILLIPVLSLVLFINIIIFFLNFINLLILTTFYLILTKVNHNKEKNIVYTNKFFWLNNEYIIFLYYQIFEVPKKYSFLFLYSLINFIKDFKNKNIKLKNFKELILNFLIRYVFLLLTCIPILIVKINNKIVKKLILTNSFSYESKNAWITTLMFNIMELSTSNINSFVNKLKIKIKDGYINLNLSILKYTKLKKLNQYLVKKKIFLSSTKLINEESLKGILSIKNKNYKLPIVKHLSLLIKANNGKIYYINETSKENFWIWDDESKKMEVVKLKYCHNGFLNFEKETYYTNIIKIDNEDIILESLKTNIKELNLNNTINSNLSSVFLLNSDDKMFNQKTVKDENTGKSLIVTKPDKNYSSFYEELNSNEKLFSDNVRTAVNESKEFFYLNNNILDELLNEEKIEFMEKIIKLNGHLEFTKDVIFSFYHKT